MDIHGLKDDRDGGTCTHGVGEEAAADDHGSAGLDIRRDGTEGDGQPIEVQAGLERWCERAGPEQVGELLAGGQAGGREKSPAAEAELKQVAAACLLLLLGEE